MVDMEESDDDQLKRPDQPKISLIDDRQQDGDYPESDSSSDEEFPTSSPPPLIPQRPSCKLDLSRMRRNRNRIVFDRQRRAFVVHKLDEDERDSTCSSKSD